MLFTKREIKKGESFYKAYMSTLSSSHSSPIYIRIICELFIKTHTIFYISTNCWDLRLEKLSKSLSKIMIAAEGVESKHSTSLKHQE